MKYLATFLLFISALSAVSQKTLADKKTDLDNMLWKGTKQYVKANDITYRLLDSLLKDNMYIISGTGLKEGKSSSTSATIDDKSATITYSRQPWRNQLIFLQPTISAASQNGFASIFANGAYGRTLSGGANLQFFLLSSIKMASSDKNGLHNKLALVEKKYEILGSITPPIWQADSALACQDYQDALDVFQNINKGIPINLSQITDSNSRSVSEFYAIARKLIDAKLLDAAILKKTPAEILDAIKHLSPSDVYTRKMLTITDSLQYHAQATKVIHWLTFGANYNNQPEPMLNTVRPGKATSFYNEYVTIKAAYNRLWIKKNNVNIYLSPTFNYSDPRGFKTANEKTANFVSPVTIGNATAQRIDSTISYFTSVPARANTWYVEVPVVFFWTSTNFGVDISVRAGANDPNNDNVGGHIGAYIPVGKKGDGVVLIEPLLRFDNLFSSSHNNFLKDNISFGFNVSVSLPGFVQSK